MNKIEKLQNIFDNWMNGNRGDMIKLVKSYGISKWMVDFLENLSQIKGIQNPTNQYANMVYYIAKYK